MDEPMRVQPPATENNNNIHLGVTNILNMSIYQYYRPGDISESVILIWTIKEACFKIQNNTYTNFIV